MKTIYPAIDSVLTYQHLRIRKLKLSFLKFLTFMIALKRPGKERYVVFSWMSVGIGSLTYLFIRDMGS